MRLRRLFLLSLALLLTSCVSIHSTDMRVTFRADENWEAEMEIVLTPQQAQLTLGQIEPALNQAVAEMRSEGVEVQWKQQERREDGNIGYLVSAKGKGLDILNTAFFEGQAVLYVDESTGERQIVFSYTPGQAFAQEQTFTLVGGKIISSNGTQTNGRTVTWVNPTGPMEAVLTEASPLGWLPYALIGGGGVLLIIAGVGIVASVVRRRQLASPAPEAVFAPPPPPTARCANCGFALPEGAVFCPSCGMKRR